MMMMTYINGDFANVYFCDSAGSMQYLNSVKAHKTN